MNEAQNKATVIPAAELTQAADPEDRRVLRLVLFDALASEAMGTLTTGVFLVGFAVVLGAKCRSWPRSPVANEMMWAMI
jgi:hypothetical protein